MGWEGVQKVLKFLVLFPIYNINQLDSFCTLKINFIIQNLELLHNVFDFYLVLDLTCLFGKGFLKTFVCEILVINFCWEQNIRFICF